MKVFAALALLFSIVPTIVADAPWFVLISNTRMGQGFTRCGGVLVYPDIVLTSGNCAWNSPDIVMRVGYQTDTQSKYHLGIKGFYDHPDEWKNNGGRFQEHLPNDLQLVKLNYTITDIEPIKLYNHRDYNRDLDGDNGVALKFAHAGAKEDYFDVPKKGFRQSKPPHNFHMGAFPRSDTYHSRIQEGDVETVSFQTCTQEYIDIPGFHSKLDEGVQLCTNQSKKPPSPCDSSAWGSPLWYEQNDNSGRYLKRKNNNKNKNNNNGDAEKLLVGIASQGECTYGGLSFVYTRISTYYDFIVEHICDMTSAKHDNIDCSKVAQKI